MQNQIFELPELRILTTRQYSPRFCVSQLDLISQSGASESWHLKPPNRLLNEIFGFKMKILIQNFGLKMTHRQIWLVLCFNFTDLTNMMTCGYSSYWCLWVLHLGKKKKKYNQLKVAILAKNRMFFKEVVKAVKPLLWGIFPLTELCVPQNGLKNNLFKICQIDLLFSLASLIETFRKLTQLVNYFS